LKYPPILKKDEDKLSEFFSEFKNLGFTQQ